MKNLLKLIALILMIITVYLQTAADNVRLAIIILWFANLVLLLATMCKDQKKLKR